MSRNERRAIVAGPDAEGLGDALESEGATVARIDGIANRPALEEAGVLEADLLVLTDPGDATAIPVARDLNPEIRVVVYAAESLPEFAKAQADLAVDPAILGVDVVAEELVGESAGG